MPDASKLLLQLVLQEAKVKAQSDGKPNIQRRSTQPRPHNTVDNLHDT